MARYDWYNRYDIESKPCTYVVHHKMDGRPMYNGMADDAFYRLASCPHPQYVEGTYVVITYVHGNTSRGTLLNTEAEHLARSRLPRKNVQGNWDDIRLCRHPLCRRTVVYPEGYCWQHSYEETD